MKLNQHLSNFRTVGDSFLINSLYITAFHTAQLSHYQFSSQEEKIWKCKTFPSLFCPVFQLISSKISCKKWSKRWTFGLKVFMGLREMFKKKLNIFSLHLLFIFFTMHYIVGHVSALAPVITLIIPLYTHLEI